MCSRFDQVATKLVQSLNRNKLKTNQDLEALLSHSDKLAASLAL